MEFQDRKGQEARSLLRTAQERLPQLKELLSEMSDHWNYEDSVYRFYHHSFKVYDLQTRTKKIIDALQALAPHLKLNDDFAKIITQGTSKRFDMSHNKDWLRHTRPMVEAFFHTRHVLEMICKYTEELKEPPQLLPSGWATVLYVYNLR